MTESDDAFDSEGDLDAGGVVAPRHTKTLRWAMLWYIAVNLAIGLPLLLIPVQFLDIIGVDDATAVTVGGLR